jgi:hypothetical protein
MSPIHGKINPKICQLDIISVTTGGNIVPARTGTIEVLFIKSFERAVFKFSTMFTKKKVRPPDITKATPRPINLLPFSTKSISKIITTRRKNPAPAKK